MKSNKFLCVKLKRTESVKTERKKFVKFRVRVSVILQKLKFDFLRQIVWKNVNKSLRNKVEEFNHKNFQKWYLEFWQVFRAAKNCVLKNFWTSKIAGILDLQISKSENLSFGTFWASQLSEILDLKFFILTLLKSQNLRFSHF